MRMNIYRAIHLVVLTGVFVICGCSALGALGDRPEVGASPSSNSDPAAQACSTRLDSIPYVIVRSGKPTLAGAFTVTGQELTNYFVQTLGASPDQSNGSDWWNLPTKDVVVCFYDGDFSTTTPGPQGHDTSAKRVLVVISEGVAEFWASTVHNATLPAVDPAKMGS
jgi:hypothetical protein